MAAARRLRRTPQRDSMTSAAAWRRYGGSVSGAGGSAPAQRRKLGGGTAEVVEKYCFVLFLEKNFFKRAVCPD